MKQEQGVTKIKTRALIRSTVAGKDSFLCIKKIAGSQVYYTLPGGSYEAGEDLQSSLARECREEIAAEVEVQQLLAVCEHSQSFSSGKGASGEAIGGKVTGGKATGEKAAGKKTAPQKLEFVFAASPTTAYSPTMGPEPDQEQVEVFWMPVAKAKRYRFIPPQLPELLSGQREIRFLNESTVASTGAI